MERGLYDPKGLRPSRESWKNALISTRWAGKADEHEKHLQIDDTLTTANAANAS